MRYKLTIAEDGEKMLVDLWDIRAVVDKRNVSGDKPLTAIIYTNGQVSVVANTAATVYEWIKEADCDGDDGD